MRLSALDTTITKVRGKLYAVTLALLFIFSAGLAAPSASAAVVTELYLTPASSAVTVGQKVTVLVRLNPGTTVDTVDTQLSYDQAVLQYVSTDSSTSPFTTQIFGDGGNGIVALTRTVLAPDTVDSDALVATVTFTALKASTGTPLALAGSVAYAGTDVATVATGSTVTVTRATSTGDTTAPVVNIKKPLANSLSGTMFAIKVGATDNVKVTKMAIYADGTLLYTAKTNSINPYNWDVSSGTVAKGAHTITVKAYDAAGNVGSSSVTVTKI